MTTAIPDNTLRSMAFLLGTLPPGDVPVAWFMSTTPEVINGYLDWQNAQRKWNDRYAELLKESELAGNTAFYTNASRVFTGMVPPKGALKYSRFLREDKEGKLIPRKRTKAERGSKVTALFEACAEVPQAADFLPGMPDTIWGDNIAYPVHVRMPGKAVLAFLALAPEDATEPFEVGLEWSRLKLSTFHLLRERQEAGKR